MTTNDIVAIWIHRLWASWPRFCHRLRLIKGVVNFLEQISGVLSLMGTLVQLVVVSELVLRGKVVDLVFCLSAGFGNENLIYHFQLLGRRLWRILLRLCPAVVTLLTHSNSLRSLITCLITGQLGLDFCDCVLFFHHDVAVAFSRSNCACGTLRTLLRVNPVTFGVSSGDRVALWGNFYISDIDDFITGSGVLRFVPGS